MELFALGLILGLAIGVLTVVGYYDSKGINL